MTQHPDHHDPRLAVAAALLLASVALAGCSSKDNASATASSPAADRTYFYDVISQARSGGVGETGLGADSLEEVLPNHEYSGETPTGTVKFSLSDLVVIGRITDVTKGEARAHTGDDGYRIVDFDDPAADERSVTVNVTVQNSFGEQTVPDTIQFRLGLAGADDPNAFISGVENLGDVAVVLSRVKDGADEGTLFPSMGAALIGRVASDGALSFPGLGQDEAAFLAGVDTLKELSATASEPTTVTEVDTPS